MENAEKQGSHLGEYGMFSTSDLFPCSKYFLSFQKKKKSMWPSMIHFKLQHKLRDWTDYNHQSLASIKGNPD